MASILVLFAHPAFERSRAQRAMLRAIADLDDVAIVDLYETYPDFVVDVAAEQRRLVERDVIVFQHPIFWHAAPSLMKEWIDLVLERGFAYGPRGDQLRGKRALNAVSTGGGADGYCARGVHGRDLRDFLAPFEETMRYCGMRYVAPFVAHDAHGAAPSSALARDCKAYRGLMRAIADDRLDWNKAEAARRLGPDIAPLLIERGAMADG